MCYILRKPGLEKPLFTTFKEKPAMRAMIGAMLQSLAWGPPYWPEIAVALATISCILWLIMRLQRQKEKAEKPAD